MTTTPHSQRRAAGVLLAAGPAVLLLVEFISAAAWTDPPYSYTYNFISNLGVRGPSTLFGQYMASPLYWLMNTGFIVFGIVIFAGVTLLKGLSGTRRLAVMTAALLLAVGGVLLGLFPGSGESLNDGSGEFHTLGAFGGFLSGNVLAIMLGRMHSRIGLSKGTGRALVAVGAVGLLATITYVLVLVNGGETVGIIGLIERGATHPFLVGTLYAGLSLVRQQSRRDPSAAAVVRQAPPVDAIADSPVHRAPDPTA